MFETHTARIRTPLADNAIVAEAECGIAIVRYQAMKIFYFGNRSTRLMQTARSYAVTLRVSLRQQTYERLLMSDMGH
jgi:hypothetical protein